MQNDERERRKVIIKFSVTAVLLILAIILAYRGCTGAGKLSMKTHQSPYICTNCGYTAYYTRAEREKLVEQAAAGLSDMVCPKCGEITMKTAIKCKNCGKIYLLVMTFGEGGMKIEECPECGVAPIEAKQGKDDDE